jgi:hypothetical protein
VSQFLSLLFWVLVSMRPPVFGCDYMEAKPFGSSCRFS